MLDINNAHVPVLFLVKPGKYGSASKRGVSLDNQDFPNGFPQHHTTSCADWQGGPM